RPADHGTRRQRDEVRERDEADCERRAGQLVHLVGERDLGYLRPDERDALPEPEPPERGIAAKRRDVEREPRSSLTQATALSRSDPGFVRQNSLASSVPKPRKVRRVASATRRIIAAGQPPAKPRARSARAGSGRSGELELPSTIYRCGAHGPVSILRQYFFAAIRSTYLHG